MTVKRSRLLITTTELKSTGTEEAVIKQTTILVETDHVITHSSNVIM